MTDFAFKTSAAIENQTIDRLITSDDGTTVRTLSFIVNEPEDVTLVSGLDVIGPDNDGETATWTINAEATFSDGATPAPPTLVRQSDGSDLSQYFGTDAESGDTIIALPLEETTYSAVLRSSHPSIADLYSEEILAVPVLSTSNEFTNTVALSYDYASSGLTAKELNRRIAQELPGYAHPEYTHPLGVMPMKLRLYDAVDGTDISNSDTLLTADTTVQVRVEVRTKNVDPETGSRITEIFWWPINVVAHQDALPPPANFIKRLESSAALRGDEVTAVLSGFDLDTLATTDGIAAVFIRALGDGGDGMVLEPDKLGDEDWQQIVWSADSRYGETGAGWSNGATAQVEVRLVDWAGNFSPWVAQDATATVTQTAEPDIIIDVSRTEVIAPGSIMGWVRPKGFGVRKSWRELAIFTESDDTGTNSNYTNLAADWPLGGLSRLEAIGWKFAQVFAPTDFGGQASVTRNLTAYVYSWAHSGSNSIAITVHDPDVVFAGNLTSIVSSTGSTDGAPAGALVFSTWEEAVSHANGASSLRRILFERLQTHLVPSSGFSGSYTKTQIGTYGTLEGYATITGSSVGNNNSSEEGSLWGINFQGPYDPRDGYSISEALGNSFGLTIPKNSIHQTVFKCKASGWKNNLFVYHFSNYGVICDCDIDSWNNFAAYAANNAGHHAIIGCSLRQPLGTVNAPGKYEGAQPFYADHGPYRSNDVDGVVFSKVDMRSLNGWGVYYQPGIRFNGIGERIMPEMMLDRVYTEACAIGWGGGNYNAGTNLNWTGTQRVVARGCVIVDITASGVVTKCKAGGVDLGSSLIIIPNVPPQDGNKSHSSIFRAAVEDRDTIYWNRWHEFSIRGMTLVDQRNDNNISGNDTFEWFSSDLDVFDPVRPIVTRSGNVLHAPNRTPGLKNATVADGPLESTILRDPTYLGLYEYSEKGPGGVLSIDPSLNTAFPELPYDILLTETLAFPADTVQTFAVTAASAAYRTASQADVPREDGRGFLRDTTNISPGWRDPDAVAR